MPVTSSNTTSVSPSTWEESTGLLSTLIPQAAGSTALITNPQTFNASRADLKLGPVPLPEELRTEAERILREQAVIDRDPSAQYDFHYTRPAPMPGVVAPTEADLLPHPPTFKMIDIQREVEKVRDARKKIRLEPTALASLDSTSPHAVAARARALPSICAYTLHDVPEGSATIAFCSMSSD